MDTLILIDPDDPDRALAVQLAADALEALTAGETPPHERFVVLAEAGDCLEIGLSVLGRGSPRTVEGGERTPSPLTIVPVRDTTFPGGSKEPSALLPTADAEGDFGTLSELVAFGAVEVDSEWPLEREPGEIGNVAVRFVRSGSVASVFVMAATDKLLSYVREGTEKWDARWHDFRPRALAGMIEAGERPGDRDRRELWNHIPEYGDEPLREEVLKRVQEACLLSVLLDRVLPEETPPAR